LNTSYFLKLHEKGEFLWKEGKHVEERLIYGKYVVQIHCFDNFFVEVYYSVRGNNIDDIKAIHKGEDWDGYLDSIKLEHLMKS